MNQFNFIQAGGFPFTANTLDAMQTAYKVFNAFGGVMGNLTILDGCTPNSGNTAVSDGFVFVDGEVYPFVGGAISDTVIIVSTPITEEFENGQLKTTYTKKHATFGNGAGYSWGSFVKIETLRELQSKIAGKAEFTTVQALLERVMVLEKKANVFQQGGGMVLWNKPANLIPVGWAEVVDWRERMPIGWNPDDQDGWFDDVGKVGGYKKVQLNEQNIPYIDLTNGKHKYLLKISDGHNQTNSVFDNTGNGNEPDVSVSGIKELNKFGSMNPIPITTTGPYRTVIFIEYVG